MGDLNALNGINNFFLEGLSCSVFGVALLIKQFGSSFIYLNTDGIRDIALHF